MADGIGLIVYPVTDLAQAKPIYRALLGVDPYVDQPYYVGFRVDGREVGLDPNGHKKGMTGPVGYREVADIRAGVKELVAAGAKVHQDVQDVGGGKLTAMLADPDNNMVGLSQA
jgi:predicted enzyme related to lactoylglutathione lyase